MKFSLTPPKKKFSNKLKKNNLRSQIAVIITLVIAFIILLTIVFVNIFKVSTIKTTTSQAADKAALTLASQMGSLSKTYWDALHAADPSNPSEEICSTDWFDLVKLAVAAIAVLLLAAWFAAPLILLMGIGVFVSGMVMGGISQKFQDMSAYNSLREQALFQAVSMVQTDDLELRATSPGKFLEPISNMEYDLTDNPGCGADCLAALKVGRFEAWYWEKRQPLVGDEGLKVAVNGFIDGVIGGSRDGISKFVEIDSWDPLRWKITGLSYILAGQRSEYAGEFIVTCSGASCPTWVSPSGTDWLRLARIDSNDQAYGGVLKDKFDGSILSPQLLRRLENDYWLSYGNIFCATGILHPLCNNPIVNEDNFGTVQEDMRHLLVRIKEVLNLPLSERMRGLTLWFTAFYDPSAHDPGTDTNIYDKIQSPGVFEPGEEDLYKYDIYLRLARDLYYINKWIEGLETFNDTIIIPPITNNDYGTFCPEAGDATIALGDPRVTHECFSGLSVGACNHNCQVESMSYYNVSDGNACITPIPARFRGNYGSCTDANHDNHPVCQAGRGDFYFSRPGWCDSRYAPPCVECPLVGCGCTSQDCVGCAEGCWGYTGCGACGGCQLPPAAVYGPGAIPTEFYYQGQLSWRPGPATYPPYDSGHTEVGQAIDILKEWRDDLMKLRMIIHALQLAIEAQQNDALRNELVYAWQDKYPVAGKTATPVYGHLVRARIIGYPKELPYISEHVDWQIPWIITWKCRQIHAYKGSFEIEVSRYDQDQSNTFWNLRRRPHTTEDEYLPTWNLYAIANEILGYGRTGWYDGALRQILDTLDTNGRPQYIITSKSKVHFGPKKEDIYIMSVDGGAESPP